MSDPSTTGAGWVPADQPGTFTDPYYGAPVSAAPPPYPTAFPTPYPAPYPAAYPAPYPPAYPAPYPAPLPTPVWAAGSNRPGQVTAAAVLAFITAGLLILSGLVLLAGASLVHDLSSSLNSDDNGAGAELAFDGLVNLVAASLLITAGVMIGGGNPAGRILLAVGGGITVAMSIYWMIRVDAFGPVVVWALAYAAMPIIAVSVIFTRPVTAWMATRSAH